MRQAQVVRSTGSEGRAGVEQHHGFTPTHIKALDREGSASCARPELRAGRTTRLIMSRAAIWPRRILAPRRVSIQELGLVTESSFTPRTRPSLDRSCLDPQAAPVGSSQTGASGTRDATRQIVAVASVLGLGDDGRGRSPPSSSCRRR